MENKKGILYVVGLPIGNLKDITLRALEVLKQVNIVVCEDTRSIRKLLTYYGCGSKKLISLYKGVELERSAKVITLLEEGNEIALVSEAGSPLIFDPGAYLVYEAHKKGIKVIPIPGASALCCALSVSGIDLKKGFIFLGFLPRSKTEQKEILKHLTSDLPLVIFESPHRMAKTVKNLLEILGNRECFLARELTKMHEELLWTDLLALSKRENFIGEITLIVMPEQKEKKEKSQTSSRPRFGLTIKRRIKELRAQQLKPREIAKLIAKEFNLPAKDVYSLILELEP